MSLLNTQAVLDAAHIAYASVYASEFEERGGRFGAGSRIEESVDRLPDGVQLPIAWRYIGRIEEAWGYELGLVFYHMGLRTVDEQTSALWQLFMGCMGHGVAITDDFDADFRSACAILGMRDADASPIVFEPMEWTEFAEERLDLSRGQSLDYGR